MAPHLRAGPSGRHGAASHVLLVSPAFFGYERSIEEEFRAAGAEVTYVDERFSNHWTARALVRLAPAVARPLTHRHFRRALARLGDRRVDLVLIIKGETVPEWFLREVIRRNPAVRTAYYSFDAKPAKDNADRLIPLCDAAFSFDRADVAADRRLQYKPLFVSRAYTPGAHHRDRGVAMAHVGTVNPERYALVTAVAAAVGPATVHLYAPARTYVTLRRVVDPRFRRIDPRGVSTRKLAPEEVAARFREARVVVDVQQSGQSGLTMRTFEALASGAALLTTNPSVAEEEFFDPSRIAIVRPDDRRAAVEAVARLAAGHLDGSPPPGFEAYSLSRWVADFLALLDSRTERSLGRGAS